MRPLAYQLLNGLTLDLEQADEITLNKLKLFSSKKHIDIENYAIEEEEFYGGARNPQRLENLKK